MQFCFTVGVAICRYRERCDVEARLVQLQLEAKTLGVGIGASGSEAFAGLRQQVRDLETAWAALEKAETAREKLVREQLVRCVS